ncbi:MAG: cytochrome P450 [Anaerolineales bacterium]|nr:cytochrome P450 [Anaerolineales bacterium]
MSVAAEIQTTVPPLLPGGTMIMGHYGAFREDPLRMFREAALSGPVCRLRIGGITIYGLNAPEAVQHVLQTNYRNYRREQRVGDAVRLIAGENLFTSDGEAWLRRRRLLQPAFHRQRIANFATMIVRETEALMADWPERMARGEYVDLEQAMTRLTSQVIGRAMLSVNLERDAGDLRESFDVVSRYSIDRIMNLLTPPLLLPTAKNRSFRQAVLTIQGALGKILAERQAMGEDEEPAGDLLDMLLAARDEETGAGLTGDQLIAELNSIVFAGHETTATTLTFAFHLLMAHPEILAAVQSELDEALGDRPPTLADLPALDLTRRVMLETLRMYPAAWASSRDGVEADVIAGYAIPAGARLTVNIYGIHYRPDFWPEPDRFDPDRFLPENSAERPKLAFLPFLTGPRKCIGDEFAQLEAQLVLATILQRYTPTLKLGHQVETAIDFVLKTKYGLPVRLQPR